MHNLDCLLLYFFFCSWTTFMRKNEWKGWEIASALSSRYARSRQSFYLWWYKSCYEASTVVIGLTAELGTENCPKIRRRSESTRNKESTRNNFSWEAARHWGPSGELEGETNVTIVDRDNLFHDALSEVSLIYNVKLPLDGWGSAGIWRA